MDRGEMLKKACDDVVAAPELRPEYSKDNVLLRTFCNIGARRVAQAMGCREFDDENLNADAQYAIMAVNASRKWKRVDGREATLHALDGGLAFAAATSTTLGAAHGHIAAIRPEAMVLSGSLGRYVPMVANVGKGDPEAPLLEVGLGKKTCRNWNCKVSQAFPYKKGEPSYFIWKEVA